MGYWEVQLGGQWKSLGRVVGEACKDAKARGAKQVKFKARGSEYVIDFDQLTQTNIATGKSRPIRLRSYKQHGDPHVTVHNPPPAAPPSERRGRATPPPRPSGAQAPDSATTPSAARA